MYQQTAICSTLNSVPMTANALQKSRLPFGLHLFPFAQVEAIPESQDGPIVRCGICRGYINPYVQIGDQRTWQCNLCGRYNELPPQFIYDYTSNQYYDLGTKIELTSETVEYIASSEYMVRPPQPACYLFVFDCSRAAAELGYLPVIAAAIADLFDEIPGDARASIGFIGYDSNVHYFSFCGTQVVHHVCPDVTSDVIPCLDDGIMANMDQKREMILDFLMQTLTNFHDIDDLAATNTHSALGPAVKAAVRVLSRVGGKIIIIQAQLPNYGPPGDGSILVRRGGDLNPKAISSDKNGDYLTPLINPATEYYKSLALQCSEHQISVDLFNLSTSYADLATVSQLVKFNAGSIYHYSNSITERNSTLIRLDHDFRNSLVKPIGLESVLRLRFTRGLKIHAFHGNFFVRSPNLLVLPNANPDASMAFQIAIEDDLKPDTRYVYFQASLLYTNTVGERRIRVHTARYPVASSLPEIIYGANQTSIVAMLAKMAVDRSMQASVGEAREALISAGVDLLEVYALADDMRARSYSMGLPENLRLIPLYILALLKHIALNLGPSTRLDDRIAAMDRFKTLPLEDLITYIYPDLFPLHNIPNDPNEDWKNPIQLTAANIERNGAYLVDAFDVIIIYICELIEPRWCYDVFGVNDYASIPEQIDLMTQGQSNVNSFARPRDPVHFTGAQHNQLKESTNANSQLLTSSEIAERPLVNLPVYENVTSTKLREFLNCLINSRPQQPKFYILKENNRARHVFTQYLVDDRSENYHSYAEFWKFLQDQARK